MAEPIAEFSAARVGRLATVGAANEPHVVPVVFAVSNAIIHTAVDGKPKSTNRLRRLANIERNASVSVLVDHYDEDWTQLWWVRADGTAAVHDDGNLADAGRALLRAKYPQYEDVSLDGPVIAITVQRWSHWSAR